MSMAQNNVFYTVADKNQLEDEFIILFLLMWAYFRLKLRAYLCEHFCVFALNIV